MLLSIDRVLQLLSEGKSIQKIAQMSGADESDVRGMIEEARRLLESSDKARARKKFIIRKKAAAEDSAGGEAIEASDEIEELFEGAEISAVPLDSSLVMYVDGASRGNPGPAGIGIVIFDADNRQVGKVCARIGEQTNNFAEYAALIRALRIANYFRVKVLRIRTDSELVAKQVAGEYKVSNENIRPLYEEVVRLKKNIANCKIEYVSRNQNDKADYLAKKAVSQGGGE